jgi:hypothetical protein
MSQFNNLGLVEHAKMALREHWGYVYSTYGRVLNESILQEAIKEYPTHINQYLSFIRSNWMNRRTTDCVNLIKSYLWWNNGNIKPTADIDYSADGTFGKATEKGILSTIPEIPGICVWRSGHIGIYIGEGQVIESRGTKFGVVQTPLTGKGANTWTHWLKYPFIDYMKEEKDLVDNIPQWKIDNMKYMLEKGWITSEHDPLEKIDVGMLGAILKNFETKIKAGVK